jgi:hypothetical protein
MFELDVAAPTSSCPAKGIVSTVATAAKTTWEKARSESSESVRHRLGQCRLGA